jgi:hypothetical protein
MTTALHLAPPPPDERYQPTEDEIARAKACHDLEVAKAEVEMQMAEHEADAEWRAGILTIVELCERFGAARVHGWVRNVGAGMGIDVCR